MRVDWTWTTGGTSGYSYNQMLVCNGPDDDINEYVIDLWRFCSSKFFGGEIEHSNWKWWENYPEGFFVSIEFLIRNGASFRIKEHLKWKPLINDTHRQNGIAVQQNNVYVFCAQCKVKCLKMGIFNADMIILLWQNNRHCERVSCTWPHIRSYIFNTDLISFKWNYTRLLHRPPKIKFNNNWTTYSVNFPIEISYSLRINNGPIFFGKIVQTFNLTKRNNLEK